MVVRGVSDIAIDNNNESGTHSNILLFRSLPEGENKII